MTKTRHPARHPARGLYRATRVGRLPLLVLALLAAFALPVPVPAQDSPAPGLAEGAGRGAVTNLPLPRFVSLKSSEGNARRGPGLSHRIDWVFRHSGMPLMVTAEYEHWRRVQDAAGAAGWVHFALLSGVRTAVVVSPDPAALRAAPDADARLIARAEPDAVLDLQECAPEWCRVSGDGASGWILRDDLWGVFPGERLE